MKTLALEIHDAGILAVEGSGPLPPSSPGYALLDGETVVTGREASGRSRLKPRFVHHRFWHDLDTAPLPRPLPRRMSTASLAHAHLADYWRDVKDGVDSVILAIPGSFSEHQLGLVLGIARACEIPVDGMVDAAVAAASGFAAKRLLHLDAHLHRLVLTELRRAAGDDGAEWATRRVETVDDTGLVAVRDALARHVSELFVHATRFDPLHSAASEQEVYKLLPGWMRQVRDAGTAEVTVRSGKNEHAIVLARDDLAAAAAPYCERARALVRSATRPGEPVALLVTPRLEELPGMEACLAGLTGVDWAVLGAGASGVGALRARDVVRTPGEEALAFVTRLPILPDAVPVASRRHEEARPRTAPADRVPTHLVRGGLAYPITPTPFLAMAPWSNGHGDSAGERRPPSCKIYRHDGVVVADVPDTTDGRSHVALNGETVAGRVTLAPGDRLRVGRSGTGALELELIAVVE